MHRSHRGLDTRHESRPALAVHPANSMRPEDCNTPRTETAPPGKTAAQTDIIQFPLHMGDVRFNWKNSKPRRALT